jgi:2-hydroxycyclohexanecarboxyl-CoA dehydrogenase
MAVRARTPLCWGCTVTPRVAVVTGAASGLGAAVAATLLAEGWLVAGLDLRPSNTSLSLITDVTDSTAVVNAVGQVSETLGSINALVTVAGIYEESAPDDITEERWNRMFAINVGGTANACAAVIPHFTSQGGGSIVTISSDLGLGGSQGDAHYAATKGAIVGLTRSLATELAPHKIAVNSVAPGAADTPLLAADSPWRSEAFLATWPVHRLVSPAEIADSVLFLINMGTAMTGQIISPNSGATI